MSKSTMTAYFKKEFPERHINVGIAEADMIGTAAGIATTGKIPFASTFAHFAAGRAFDQVRNSVAYPHFKCQDLSNSRRSFVRRRWRFTPVS